MNYSDDKVLEFDNLMYGIMLAQLEATKIFTRLKNTTISKANILLIRKVTIPQIKVK